MKPYYEHAGITIYHGDCREILLLIPDCSVDFVFTDPPFGHNNNNNGDLIHRWEAVFEGKTIGKARPIALDGPEANDLFRWAISQYKRLLFDGSCCCCCGGGGGPDPQFARWSLWLDEAMNFKHMIVWDKGPMGMGHHYRRSYETVLVAQKGNGPCRWYDKSKRVENIIRNIPKILPAADQHPTVKPVDLASFFIKLHSKPTDLILDPFMGSGTTLLAAKRLDRRAIGIEIEEKYCEIAAKRLSQEVLEFSDSSVPILSQKDFCADFASHNEMPSIS